MRNISRLQETTCSHRWDSPEGENQVGMSSQWGRVSGWMGVVKDVEGAQYLLHWSSSAIFGDTTGQGTESAASKQPATGLCRHKHRGQSLPHRTPRPHHKGLTVKDYVPHNWLAHYQSTMNTRMQSMKPCVFPCISSYGKVLVHALPIKFNEIIHTSQIDTNYKLKGQKGNSYIP